MAQLINLGWSKPGDEIPQPVGVVLGGNLRTKSEPQSPPKPKIQHGSSSGLKHLQLISPAEAEKLGIDTGPVLVISPVPTAPTPSSHPRTKPARSHDDP